MRRNNKVREGEKRDKSQGKKEKPKNIPLIHIRLENVGMQHRHRKVKAKIRAHSVCMVPEKGIEIRENTGIFVYSHPNTSCTSHADCGNTESFSYPITVSGEWTPPMLPPFIFFNSLRERSRGH